MESLPSSRSGARNPANAARVVRPLSDKLILSVALCVGLFICFVSAVANAFLLRTQLPAAPLLMKFNAAGGVIAMLLVWRLLRWSRERNALLRERAKVVVQLNHEIRNAIQTISLHGRREHGDPEPAIDNSVARIEHALDEYVPNDAETWKIWHEGRERKR
jgi:hypothetical protein